jgi:uncharacterized membrane protein YtjA (UPF0391 family)
MNRVRTARKRLGKGPVSPKLARNRNLPRSVASPRAETLGRRGLWVAELTGMLMDNLLHYALVFLVIALVAAAVGFGGVAGFAMEAARLLFWVFIVLFVVSLVAGLVRRT